METLSLSPAQTFSIAIVLLKNSLFGSARTLILSKWSTSATTPRSILFAITNSLRYGAGVTIVTGLTIAVGMAILGVIVGYGLGTVMAASYFAFITLKLVCGGYLIWLGIKIYRDRSAFLVDAAARQSQAPLGSLVFQALTISLTNPKALLTLAALIPPFIDPFEPFGLQVVILALTYCVMCMANHFAIAHIGDSLRRFLHSPKRTGILRRVTGSAFIGFGSALLATSRP